MDGFALEYFYNFMMDETNTNKEENLKESESLLHDQLKDILNQFNVRTVFQPIVSLVDASVMGYEALSRGPEGSDLELPDILFGIARRFGRIWDLESLCRMKALELAKDIFPEHMLFINVDPKVIYDEKFRQGFTKTCLYKYNIDPENIIFEITEKTSVDDFKSFKKAIDNYNNQGYKIAIDDVGSGYSGLNLLAEIRPQYLKIDMHLIRDIDKDGLKQTLIRTLHDFCLLTNIKMIAEGIETVNELTTLIDIGIQYGQGYLIQKPVSHFGEIPDNVKELILERNKIKNLAYYQNSSTIAIGDIARKGKIIPPQTTGSQVLEIFNANPNLKGIPVVDGGKLVGLIMKDRFFAKLGTQYGVAIYMKRPITLLMNRNPLVVDYYLPLDKVSKLAMARKEDDLYDYVIVTRDDQYDGIITVKDLLEKSTALEINYAKHLNALTALPGNTLIEKKIHSIIDENKEYCILYIDLDNFKSYNDVYGFENGDRLIQLTARILQEETAKYHALDTFVGHIGGDDFVIVLNTHHVQELCDTIISKFDIAVKELYKKEDVEKGYIISKNRHGKSENFPIVTISLAGITNKHKKYLNVLEIGEAAGQRKKVCKMQWCSCSNID